MPPSKLSYRRADSLNQALEWLAADPQAKPLAGGHSLIPAMNLRLAQPETVIDIGRIEDLRGVTLRDGALRIGALTTHAEIACSELVRSHCPALSQACGLVGDLQVRNWGTLGGNIAHADPASDPPPVLLAAEARVHLVRADGDRSVAIDDFFLDLFAVDLQPGELIASIEVPSWQEGRSGYGKLSHPASGYSLAGVAVCLRIDTQGRCSAARASLGGAVPQAIRCPGVESILVGSDLGSAAREKASQSLIGSLGDEVLDDIHAPRDYRRAMAGVYLKRALASALDAH